MCNFKNQVEIRGQGLSLHYLNQTTLAEQTLQDIDNYILADCPIVGDNPGKGCYEYHVIDFGDWELIIIANTQVKVLIDETFPTST